MARAILVTDNGNERDYQITGGRVITLKLEDDLSQMTFWENGKQLGRDQDFLFDDSESSNNSYLLARMYVPIKGAGLGRASLEFFKEYTEADVFARENDGQVRDDGSHLTEDAPGFVAKMIGEGLLLDNTSDFNDSDYY